MVTPARGCRSSFITNTRIPLPEADWASNSEEPSKPIAIVHREIKRPVARFKRKAPHVCRSKTEARQFGGEDGSSYFSVNAHPGARGQSAFARARPQGQFQIRRISWKWRCSLMFAAHELLQWMPGPVRTTGVPAVLRLGCQGAKKCSGWCSLGCREQQVPPLRSPGFPVGVRGDGELRAAF
jgi:hypothetical protein